MINLEYYTNQNSKELNFWSWRTPDAIQVPHRSLTYLTPSLISSISFLLGICFSSHSLSTLHIAYLSSLLCNKSIVGPGRSMYIAVLLLLLILVDYIGCNMGDASSHFCDTTPSTNVDSKSIPLVQHVPQLLWFLAVSCTGEEELK
jgi:hypothetical protein